MKWYGTSTDIEDLKRAEEVLREQARLLDLTHDTVFVRDMNDVITYWNRGAEALYGWSRDEAVGKISHQLTQTISPHRSTRSTRSCFAPAAGRVSWCTPSVTGPGSWWPAVGPCGGTSWGDPLRSWRTNNDVTERKQAEAELRDSEGRYRHIFQSAGVSIWEEDFSEVKAAIDNLKAQGVTDFREYLATHPDFVLQAIAMVKIIDVNDTTLDLLRARSKDELLVSLHRFFCRRRTSVRGRADRHRGRAHQVRSRDRAADHGGQAALRAVHHCLPCRFGDARQRPGEHHGHHGAQASRQRAAPQPGVSDRRPGAGQYRELGSTSRRERATGRRRSFAFSALTPGRTTASRAVGTMLWHPDDRERAEDDRRRLARKRDYEMDT